MVQPLGQGIAAATAATIASAWAPAVVTFNGLRQQLPLGTAAVAVAAAAAATAAGPGAARVAANLRDVRLHRTLFLALHRWPVGGGSIPCCCF